MKIAIVVAMGKKREIGRNNKLLWHIPADLQNFKKLTLGHCLIMGRKTFASIGKALPGRHTIILTRQQDFWPPAGGPGAPSCEVAHDWAQAKLLAQQWQAPSEEVMVVGGAEIYAQALPECHKLYLSNVDFSGEADTFFPSYQHLAWQLLSSQDFPPQGAIPGWQYQIWQRDSVR